MRRRAYDDISRRDYRAIFPPTSAIFTPATPYDTSRRAPPFTSDESAISPTPKSRASPDESAAFYLAYIAGSTLFLRCLFMAAFPAGC